MYGHSMTVMGCGTGGIVRLFRRDDGTLFAVKEFKRSKISDRKFAISTLREYAIGTNYPFYLSKWRCLKCSN
jgi:hypothetical protein